VCLQNLRCKKLEISSFSRATLILMSRSLSRVSWSTRIWAEQVVQARVWLVLLAIVLSSDCGRSLEQTFEAVITTVREVVIRLTHPNSVAHDSIALEPQRFGLDMGSGMPMLSLIGLLLVQLEVLLVGLALAISGWRSRQHLNLIAPRGPPVCA
jgi:hypothetical protein